MAIGHATVDSSEQHTVAGMPYWTSLRLDADQVKRGYPPSTTAPRVLTRASWSCFLRSPQCYDHPGV